MNSPSFQTPVYVRSRRAYTLECAFEYFVALMVTDAFLANLLSHMGIGDAAVGVISSLISLAFLFQLVAILVVQRIRNVKRVAVTVHIIGQLFFMLLYLLPFSPIPPSLRTAAVVLCVMLGYLGNYTVTSVIFKWGNTFVEPATRANFAATKEMISLISGMVVSLGVGWVVDRYAAQGDKMGGFLFISAVILISSLADFVCLMMMKNPPNARPQSSRVKPFWQVVKLLFQNKSFVYVVILGALIYTATFMTTGFMGIYKTKDLLLTVGLVQLINIVGCLARFLLTKPIARYSDRKSYVKGVKLGMWIAVAGFLVNMFTTPGLWWMVIVFTLIYNGSCAGTGQNMNNIVYSYVPEEYFVEASAIKNSVAGLCGFGASVVGGLILDAVQANGNQIFGITVYGQQLLSAISALILLVAIVFVSRVLEKQIIVAK